MRLMEIMTTDVQTASPDLDAETAYRMRSQRIRHLVVTEDRRVVGVEANQRMFRRALERIRHLRTGLSRHIGMEEHVLYSEYQRVTPDEAGLVRTLEAEHSILGTVLEDAEEALTAQDREQTEWALSGLREIVLPHARSERTRIYPAVDASVADGPALVRAMQEM